MKYWTTNSGEKIRLSEMTDGHLRNTIRFLEKKLSDDVELEAGKISASVKLDGLKEELRKR